jgi:outer membrane protein assembly factor BamB
MYTSPMRVLIAMTVLLASELAPAPSAPADTVWPQFRGASGRGVAEIDHLPISWSAKKNVAWTVDVPGRGWSSPIVWRDRVIATSTVTRDGVFIRTASSLYRIR